MNFNVKLLVIGSLIILLSVITCELFVDEMKKMPINYNLISEHEGQDRVLKSIDGKLSEPFLIREILRENVVGVKGNILEIKTMVTGTDSVTNQIVFNNTQSFFVDRTSRKHQNTEEFFTFPPNVQRINYEFFHPMIFTKTTFVFERVKTIDNLEVYDFSCKYRGVDISSSYPQFPSKKIFSDGKCTVSVEPVTGLVVYFSKEWDDYFVSDGNRGAQVETGGKQTSEYSKSILIDNAKSTKILYYFLDIFLPSIIVILGSVILSVIFLFEKTIHQSREIIRAQNELIKKEKLATIGEIAAKLSHDLRNPLSLIKMATDVIEMRIDKKLDPKLEEYLPMMRDAVTRMIHQVNHVLGFTKTTPLNFKLTSLSKVLEDSVKYANIRKNISVKLPAEDCSLMADKIQLEVAFSNILSNAIDAIGENNGHITIRSRIENNHLILEFEDSGSGISKEDMPKIFDPLFTTKQEGIGLGLLSVRDIIESHGGTISVKSPPTVFTITLPQNSQNKK